MLNDLKDWAIEKGRDSSELAEGVVTEVQTKGVMDWSGTVWIVIGVGLVLGIVALLDAARG